MITASTVLKAVWDLHRGSASWPTLGEIASYLETTEDVVRPLLIDLKDARIFKQHTRQRRKVWGPWNSEQFER
jgi:hypothetical protein